MDHEIGGLMWDGKSWRMALIDSSTTPPTQLGSPPFTTTRLRALKTGAELGIRQMVAAFNPELKAWIADRTDEEREILRQLFVTMPV